MKVVFICEFYDWYKKATIREKAQVDARIARMEENNHLGDWKYLNKGLAELYRSDLSFPGSRHSRESGNPDKYPYFSNKTSIRWKNGRRIYFTKLDDQSVLLLIGGYKNEQKKSIKKAYTLIERYAEFES